jgi:hypothetical protein
MCKRKRKSFTISDKIDILAKVDTHTGMRVDPTLELGLPVSKLNTTVNNREVAGRS